MKSRVAIVLPYFGSGGAENMVSRLAANLDLSRVDVEVICLYGKPLHNHLENKVRDHGIPIIFIGKNKGFSMNAIGKLWKELSVFKPNVVHTHLSACVYCAPWIFTHNVKMLHTIHNTPKFELIKSKQKVMAVMYKFHKAVPIAISNEIASMMVEEYKLSTEPELIYNPVDIARFDIEKKPHSGLKIVNVGRLSVQKNQKLLIDAIKIVVGRHSDVCLTVLGDGPLRSELENYVKEKGLEKVVYLMGNVDNVEKYFSESDIFVLSSTYEGLPLVILEAMAAQLPIVSTNVGGVKDIVTDNGILVAPNSTEALAEALEKLVKDGGLRNMLGKNSIKNVQRFDSVIIANQYMELYEKYSNN